MENNEYQNTPETPEKKPEGQGETYTWQNPNPYNGGYTGYTGYQQSVQKPQNPRKKLSWAAVGLICVSSFAVVLMLALIVTVAVLVRGREPSQPRELPGQIENTPKSDEKTALPGSDEKAVKNTDLPSIETSEPTDGTLTVPEIYKKVKDSVVGIVVTITDGMQAGRGSATGIILSEDGYISTNAHVVDDAATVKVVLADGKEYDAKVIGYDENTDLAVVKIEASGLKPAEFGSSDALVVGESVVAIGNPYGMELAGSVTTGVVSAIDRHIAIENTYMTLIQTDASINPGNSGGPLVNCHGQVIGITSSKVIYEGYEGIGFAIPISGATEIISELIQYGYIKNRPFIGIQGSDMNEQYSRIYNIPQGVYVVYVYPDSDAYAKGLKRGDIITAVDGVEIKSMAELDEQKSKHVPGDTIKLTVYRNTRTVEISVLLSESSGEK